MAGLPRCLVAFAVIASCRETSPASDLPVRGPAPETNKHPTASPASSKSCGDMSCVELGRAFERGSGRTRDYRAAADAYRRGCDAGDATSCRLYAGSITSRTIDEKLEVADAASQRACKLGDVVTCWKFSGNQFVRESVDATSEAAKQAAKDAYAVRQAQQLPLLRAACERGDIAACEQLPCEACDCDSESCAAATRKHQLELC